MTLPRCLLLVGAELEEKEEAGLVELELEEGEEAGLVELELELEGEEEVEEEQRKGRRLQG